MTEFIRADQFDFSEAASTPVVSDSLRFVLPVPAWADGGEPLDYPRGERAGQPFTDRDGRPIIGRGIVFFDPDDRSWEAVRGDGTGVILFSPLTADQGARLAKAVLARKAILDDLTLADIKAIVRYATRTLRIASSHASTREYVAEAFQPEDPAGLPGFGLHRRLANDVCRAVFVEGEGAFLGPAASPQVFDDGAVILRHGDETRLVQWRSFEMTYRLLDGRRATVDNLARQVPRAA